MKILRNWKLLVVAVCLAVLLFAVGFYPGGKSAVETGQTLALSAPPFIALASAQSSPQAFEIGEKPDDEAGIAAYFQAPTTANLQAAKAVFRTIELETADYILGSVGVPNYPEHFDAHVYVHKDGWILAYYFNNEPASKIADVKASTINTTKLTSVLSIVASAAGVPFTGESYYDFRYPNATHILYVAEDGANGNDFTITLPTNYGSMGIAVIPARYGGRAKAAWVTITDKTHR